MPPITNHTTCNNKNVYDKCMSNLNERWKLVMTLKPKLRTYIKFKEQFDIEQCINVCVSRHKRSLLAQFRIGVLHLAIEVYLYKKECVLFNMNNIEDEMHMLCTYTLYQHIWIEMYNKVIFFVCFFTFMN